MTCPLVKDLNRHLGIDICINYFRSQGPLRDRFWKKNQKITEITDTLNWMSKKHRINRVCDQIYLDKLFLQINIAYHRITKD